MLKNKSSKILFSVFVAGFSALVAQIVYLREFLNVFGGNELIVGMLLGNWMVLTGGGAWIAGKIRSRGSGIGKILSGQLLITIILPVSVGAIYWAKARFYPPGTLPGFYHSFLFSLTIMAPFTLVSGGLFTLLAHELSKMSGRQKAQQVYGIEAAGSLLGGLLFTFVLLRYLTTFQIVFSVSAVNVLAGCLLAVQKPYLIPKRGLFVVLITVLFMLPFHINFDQLAKTLVFRGQQILLNKETPYGNLVVTKTGPQINFFENGISLFSSDNRIACEEAVHYAMLQHKTPKNVLVVSGDITGLATEIMKYGVDTIIYVNVNPFLVGAMKRYAGLKDSVVNIRIADPRKYILETHSRFDVVLLNNPPPATLQLNRFYTYEFYSGLKRVLNPGGVISLPLPGGANYLNAEAAQLTGILFNTLKKSFKNVMLYPGESNYLLASDDTLRSDMAALLSEKNLNNEFVNPYYINDDLVRLKTESILKLLNPEEPVNRDFKPAAYFSQIGYYLSWYGQKIRWIQGVAIIVLLLVFLLSGTFNKALLVTGFTASVVEVVTLLAFQIFFGQLYQALALLIAVFMAGITIGVHMAGKYALKVSRKRFALNQGIIGVLVPVVFLSFGFFADNMFCYLLPKMLLYLTMLIFGVLTGIQFASAMALQNRNRTAAASSAYAADLLGAAGGAVLSSVLLIPVLGLPVTAFVLFGVNILTALFVLK